jgi:3-hydroxyisobutyrate dehydrogenase
MSESRQNESKPTVAVLGAGGTMGFGMAWNILRAGFPVRAWNRSREKVEPLRGEGAMVVDTPAEAAEGAPIVVTMLSDVDAVLHAMDGENGFLAGAEEGLVWAQMSTVGVSGIARCAALAARAEVELVDAPVLGTKEPAEKGELLVMASGPERARATLAPLFDAVGKKTMWVGDTGVGSRLKVVTNSWIVTIVEGAAETIALAEGVGVDARLFLEAIEDGPLDLPYLRLKAAAMLERDFEPSFRLALAAKDARLADDLATSNNLDLPLIRTIADRFAEAASEHGDEDLAATYRLSTRRSEQKVR